jgi:hypothetical protein
MIPADADLVAAPAPLTAAHDTLQFVCGHHSLSSWLNKRALANAASGASRTYVVCAPGGKLSALRTMCGFDRSRIGHRLNRPGFQGGSFV